MALSLESRSELLFVTTCEQVEFADVFVVPRHSMYAIYAYIGVVLGVNGAAVLWQSH